MSKKLDFVLLLLLLFDTYIHCRWLSGNWSDYLMREGENSFTSTSSSMQSSEWQKQKWKTAREKTEVDFCHHRCKSSNKRERDRERERKQKNFFLSIWQVSRGNEAQETPLPLFFLSFSLALIPFLLLRSETTAKIASFDRLLFSVRVISSSSTLKLNRFAYSLFLSHISLW